MRSDSGADPGLAGAKANTEKRQTVNLETRNETMHSVRRSRYGLIRKAIKDVADKQRKEEKAPTFSYGSEGALGSCLTRHAGGRGTLQTDRTMARGLHAHSYTHPAPGSTQVLASGLGHSGNYLQGQRGEGNVF